MKAYVIVEDDADIRGLVKMIFRREPEFKVVGEAESAEEALADLKSNLDVGLIVLDNGLTGDMTGIDAAPLFKEVLPQAKIILFTADPLLRTQAASEQTIDAFVVKTEIAQLLPTARRLCGIESPPG